jgi:hypothetical protein
MNTLLLPVSQHVQQTQVDIRLVSIAAGLAVSRHVNLPTTEVDSINMHYVGQVQQSVSTYLSIINESVVIQMDRALKVARSAYMLRYNAAYPKADGCVILPSSGSFFERYFGVSTFFDEVTLCKCAEKPDEVMALVNRLLSVMPSLIKEA